jgi:hypothetical protein
VFFTRARLFYNSTVRLVIIYRTAAWLTPKRSKKGAVVQAIQKVQNKELQAIARAYRATLIKELKKKVLIPLINIYYNKL